TLRIHRTRPCRSEFQPSITVSFGNSLRAFTTVLRKNNAPVMPRGPTGRTRGEVRSGRRAPQCGWVGRTDVDGVEAASGSWAAERAGPGPKRSAVGRGCNAVTTSERFSADAPRAPG